MWTSLIKFHHEWAWVVIATNAVAGVWSLAAYQWAAFRSRFQWWAVGLGQATMFIQVILGVALVAHGLREPRPLHMLYGFSGVFAIAILFAYRHTLRAYLYLLYGFGALFIMGLGIRAVVLT
jgi:hypothetical protein